MYLLAYPRNYELSREGIFDIQFIVLTGWGKTVDPDFFPHDPVCSGIAPIPSLLPDRKGRGDRTDPLSESTSM